ncbi:MAG: hypothetical protein LBS77_07495 [Desulfovibrio sp.]|nr:hypothetical protein [Desulfovibrio sp.]
MLGEDVHNINVLTVIANESYDSFSKGLQAEIAEAVATRPRMISMDLFKNKIIRDASGIEQVVDIELAQSIYEGLITSGYVKKGILTDKYYEDKKNGTIEIAEETADCAPDITAIIDSIYDSHAMQPENARKNNNVELQIDEGKLAGKEFKALWAKINAKSVYVVKFDEAELIDKAIGALNQHLLVSKIFFTVETSALKDIKSREHLLSGATMMRESHGRSCPVETKSNASVNMISSERLSLKPDLLVSR